MVDLFILSWDTKKSIYCVLIGPYVVVVDGNFVIRESDNINHKYPDWLSESILCYVSYCEIVFVENSP